MVSGEWGIMSGFHHSPLTTHQTNENISMSKRDELGGIVHTYRKFDPIEFPSPTAPPPDVVSQAFEHMLYYGNTRRLTEEELAQVTELASSWESEVIFRRRNSLAHKGC